MSGAAMPCLLPGFCRAGVAVPCGRACPLFLFPSPARGEDFFVSSLNKQTICDAANRAVFVLHGGAREKWSSMNLCNMPSQKEKTLL